MSNISFACDSQALRDRTTGQNGNRACSDGASGDNQVRRPTSLSRSMLLMSGRSDIEILVADICAAHDKLSLDSSIPKITTSDSPAILSKTRFKFTSPFRLPRSRSHRKKYELLDDSCALLASRRDSFTSDETLVGDDSDLTGTLLSSLAPLISGVQRLAPRIHGLHPPCPEAQRAFETACDKVLDLIVELQGHHGGGDEHDLEMRGLMLAALSRKIEVEKGSIRRLSTSTAASSTSNSSSSLASDTSTKVVTPFVPASKNPFILHAASINLSSSRTSIPGKAIPINDGIHGQVPGGYSSFVGGAQSSTWAMNVIRLGSFQNSMLFSPSPIAMIRKTGGGARA